MKLALLISVAIFGCATMAPPEVRKAEFILDTKLKKDKAYQGALTWMAKNQGDAKAVRQIEDAAGARFVTKGSYKCNALRQAGDINDYLVEFSLEFQAKDNRARFQFEDLRMLRTHNGETMPAEWAYSQLGDSAKVEQVKPCLKELADTMINSGVERQKAENW